MPDGRERRSFPRIATFLPAQVETDDGQSSDAIVVDMSLCGAFLQTP